MKRKLGIYYQHRSEAEEACIGAASITSVGGWYVCMARVLPRKTYGWIVCRSTASVDMVWICCKDGSMRYAVRRCDGMLQEIMK